MLNYTSISILFGMFLIVSLGFVEYSFSYPVTVSHVDDPTRCDFLFVDPIVDELGWSTGITTSPGPFPPDEAMDSLPTGDILPPACPSFAGPGPHLVLNVTNLSGIDWDYVWYVADPGTPISNWDGYVDGLPAFEIDTFGVNKPLVFESISPDNIFQNGESWHFIIDDNFVSAGGEVFNTLGVGVPGIFGAGSIIAFNDHIPEVGSSSQATGTTTILGTCGLSFPDGNSVNYGALIPGSLSPEVNLNMTNSGTVSALLQVSGSNWNNTSTDVMYANVTHYNATTPGNGYANNADLEQFDQIVTASFAPAVILETYWQILADLLNPSFVGSATQTMDFTVSC